MSFAVNQSQIAAGAFFGLMLAAPASAQVQPGFYFEAGLGTAYAKNSVIDELDVRSHFDLGAPTVLASVGYAAGNGLRLAVEGARRTNDFEILELAGGAGEVVTGSDDATKAWSYMVNVLYDFDTDGAFFPYLGLGLGRARTKYRVSDAVSGDDLIDDEDRSLAIQAIAGFGIELSPSWTFTADYRYWRAPDVRLHGPFENRLETAHALHSVSLGMNYRFRAVGTSPSREISSDQMTGDEMTGAGSYMALGLGSGFAEDADLNSSEANLDGFDPGPAVAAAYGFKFSNGLRWEIEASLRKNDVDIVDFGRTRGETLAAGNVESRSIMTNVLYDFRYTRSVQPYVGAGAGFARVNYDVQAFDKSFLEDHENAVSFQILLGIRARLAKRIDFTAEYRYWFAPWLTLRDPAGVGQSTHHNVHAMMMGLHYRLGG